MEIRELLQAPREVLENYVRSKTQYAYLGGGAALARVLGKYKMYVATGDISLAPHLILEGFWESWITQLLTKVQPGSRCADIGANHGYYTLVLADLVGTKGFVYSFEPQKHLHELLQKTVAVNGYAGTTITMQAAVGKKSGVVGIKIPDGYPEYQGSAHVSTDADAVDVVCVSLDELIPEKLDFIKIDVEGYEPEVWAGMQRHLQSKPTILMEFSPKSYENPHAFLDAIEVWYPLREVNTQGNIVPTTRESLLNSNDFSMLWLEA